MVEKCAQSNVRFRPHFKTHQSAGVGLWFRELGVDAITVSSVKMASYFAGHGWNDITIAFIVNPLEIDEINQLARVIKLNLTVDSLHTVSFLDRSIGDTVGVWIKTDTGYGRSGIPAEHSETILEVAEAVDKSGKLALRGFLAHAGHAYDARSKKEVRSIYRETVGKMKGLQVLCRKAGLGDLEISIGDTPTCSIMPKLDGADEVRCGNFVFFDVTQYFLGSCSLSDIAVAVACPVVAAYSDRNQVVVHGGAVHLSKDVVMDPEGQKCYGMVGPIDKMQFGIPYQDTAVRSLSQEHGVIFSTDPEVLSKKPGDLLLVYPIHSCLTVNLMKRLVSTAGDVYSTMSQGNGG